jgi:hypothetical protein
MQRRLQTFLSVLALASLGSGCAITSASQQDTSSAGGVWYTKQPFFGSTKVFYCPPSGSACYEAQVVDKSK